MNSGNLPITAVKEEICKEIASNDILIIVGETGCGKTTQIPQYLSLVLSKDNKPLPNICCIQPRRIAALKAAEQVAKELKCTVGLKVGFHVRFEKEISGETRIRFMTDGILFRELILDNLLKQYSAIILDEAHEGTLYYDLLMSFLKSAISKRNEINRPLKLIIMSATINVVKFCRFFDNCKVIYIRGREHNVDILYSENPQPSYIHSSILTVIKIHKEDKITSSGIGSILVFLTGEEEIETAAKQLNNVRKLLAKEYPLAPQLNIRVLYANLPRSMQTESLTLPNPKMRNIILSTNIAETSLTIPGVKYVVDSGRVKRKVCDPTTGLESLRVCRISRQQANQRAGRAGRDQPGICYRVYTEADWNEMEESSDREICNSDLTGIILEMIAIGIDDIENFHYFEAPDSTAIQRGLNNLLSLECVAKLDREDNKCSYKLNDLGMEMVQFPLDPFLSKLIIQSIDYECSEEILIIVSFLSLEDPIHIPLEKRSETSRIFESFNWLAGDHILYLNLMKGWMETNFDKSWGKVHFLHWKNADLFRNIFDQFTQIFGTRLKYKIKSTSNPEGIQKCLLSVLFRNLCEHKGNGKYLSLSYGRIFYIHPTSCCFLRNPEFLIFSNLVTTTKPYMKLVTPVKKEWIECYTERIEKYKTRSIFTMDILV